MATVQSQMTSGRLYNELEHRIQQINRTRISEAAGNVSVDDLLQVVEHVSMLRARYLAAVIKFGKSNDFPAADAQALRSLREAFEEAMAGYEALEHAYQRGYLELANDD